MTMQRWARLTAAGALLLAILSPSGTAAQTATFTSDVGMIVFTVRADRASVFEMVFQRLVDGLRDASSTAPVQPALALRLLRSLQGGADQRVFVVLVEPVRAAQDYSLEGLLTAVVPQEAPGLISQLRSALLGDPYIADLRVVQNLSPDNLLHARLEAQLSREGLTLGLPLGAGNEASADRERLERLRLPIWSVQRLEYRTVDTTSASWRFVWSFELVNGSLLGTASADLTLDFLDQSGAVLYSVKTREAGVPTGERRQVAGEARIPSTVASRVVSAAVRVLP